ncbi:MAG: hypothetical protein E6Q40_10770 [Cupriavidus sp.]|nr:MAG: hypothetical protein E6Q40_10770 [Cupriavidus sp.]
MTRFRPLRVSDFYLLDPAPNARARLPLLLSRPLLLHRMAEDPFSFTMDVDGAPVALVGITATNELWALLAADMRRHMVRLTRYGFCWFDQLARPLWMRTDNDDPAAGRWALLLGFERTKKGDRYDTYARAV